MITAVFSKDVAPASALLMICKHTFSTWVHIVIGCPDRNVTCRIHIIKYTYGLAVCQEQSYGKKKKKTKFWSSEVCIQITIVKSSLHSERHEIMECSLQNQNCWRCCDQKKSKSKGISCYICSSYWYLHATFTCFVSDFKWVHFTHLPQYTQVSGLCGENVFE